MPAYQLVNTVSGHSLYQVTSATPADIARANRNLQDAGSWMRYEPVELAAGMDNARLECPTAIPA